MPNLFIYLFFLSKKRNNFIIIIIILFWSSGLQDLSSLTRDWTQVLGSDRTEF